jgi:WD40 repeat protein
LESGEELRTLIGYTSYVHDVAVMPDGRHIISCSADQTLKVWALIDGAVVASFFGDSIFHCCDVVSDGRKIVIGDQPCLVHFLHLLLEAGAPLLSSIGIFKFQPSSSSLS